MFVCVCVEASCSSDTFTSSSTTGTNLCIVYVCWFQSRINPKPQHRDQISSFQAELLLRSCRRQIKTQKYLQTGMNHIKAFLFPGNRVIKARPQAARVRARTHTPAAASRHAALNIYKRKQCEHDSPVWSLHITPPTCRHARCML